MQPLPLQLVDLPDELLLMIFKTLNGTLALYSFMGINRRFDQILQDSIFTNCLTLMTCSTNSCFSPMPCEINNHFYLNILPEIYHKIQWLNLEASTMERFLCGINYPYLNKLGLYNVKEETVEHYFIGKQISFYFYEISNQFKYL